MNEINTPSKIQQDMNNLSITNLKTSQDCVESRACGESSTATLIMVCPASSTLSNIKYKMIVI